MKLLEYADSSQIPTVPRMPAQVDFTQYPTVPRMPTMWLSTQETVLLKSVKGKKHSPIEVTVIFLLMMYGVTLQLILFGLK